MRNDIVEVKAEQRLFNIAIAEDKLLDVDKAFDNLMRKFIIIADFSIFKRKPGIGKGCTWWNLRIKAAIAAAKREYYNYIILLIDYRWNCYKKAKAYVNKKIKAEKSSSWRRAVAATAYN
jgi:hypothetical protein